MKRCQKLLEILAQSSETTAALLVHGHDIKSRDIRRALANNWAKARVTRLNNKPVVYLSITKAGREWLK